MAAKRDGSAGIRSEPVLSFPVSFDSVHISASEGGCIYRAESQCWHCCNCFVVNGCFCHHLIHSPITTTSWEAITILNTSAASHTMRTFLLLFLQICTSRVVPTFKNNECNRDRDIKKLNAKLAGLRYCVENAYVKGCFGY